MEPNLCAKFQIMVFEIQGHKKKNKKKIKTIAVVYKHSESVPKSAFCDCYLQ